MNAASPARHAPAAYRRQTPTVWRAFGRAVWNALQDIGQRRAARDLRQLAQRWDRIDPAMAQQLREAAAFATQSSKEQR